MFTASYLMSEHLQSSVATLATIWKITRTDGTKFTFTDVDKDLEGVTFGTPSSTDTYKAALGYTRSAMKQSLNMEADVLEIMGAVETTGFTQEDLSSGKFDYALVEIGMVNWNDLTMGVIYLRRGYFGEVTVQDYNYVVTVKGLAEILQRPITKTFQPNCIVDLGSSECTINIDTATTQDSKPIKQVGTVITGTGLAAYEKTRFCVNITTVPVAPAGYLNDGLLVWTGVATPTNFRNAGRSFEVDEYTTAGTPVITLLFPTNLPIAVGDSFNVYIGCNHQLAHCKGRFGAADGRGNIGNFRGFPWIRPTYVPYTGDIGGGIWRS